MRSSSRRCARLVEEVNRLVRQEAVLDVARGERYRIHDGRVLDMDVVVLLETLLQSAQDRDGVFLRGRVHHNRLETTLQRGILLHVLAVLVKRRRTHAVQLAARKHRLQHVARVGGAFRLARAHDRVDFVDEQDDASVRRLDLVQHGLQALLELAAVLRAGHERRHVEREHGAVLQPLRYVATHDTLCKALHDGRLAHAGLADEDRVVLRLAGKDADHVADFCVTPYNGIELARARHLHEVASVLLQCLVLPFRVVRRNALVSAYLPQGREEVLLRHARVLDRLRGVRRAVAFFF